MGDGDLVDPTVQGIADDEMIVHPDEGEGEGEGEKEPAEESK